MKHIEKLSEVNDKLLDPRELNYRLGIKTRRRITSLLENDDLDDSSKQRLRELIEQEDENKQLLDYDALSEIHKSLQRLDSTYSQFFYQFLDECKAIAPPGRQVCSTQFDHMFVTCCYIFLLT